MNGCSMPAPAPCAMTARAVASGAVVRRAETVCVPTGSCRRSSIAGRFWPKVGESGRGRAVPRYLGVRIQRMEGPLLPTVAEGARDAALLREPVPLRGGQLHVPPAAGRDHPHHVARHDTRGVPLHAE